jgi:prephenate dehydrogenase
VRALRQVGAVGDVVGYGRGRDNLEHALDLGVIDSIADSVAEAVTNADLIVVSTPLGAIEDIFRAMVGHIAENAVITDVGSVKGAVVDSAVAAFGLVPTNFIPAHPIAGTEQSGAAASFAELYQNRRVILTPLADSDLQAVKTVTEMWELVGAEVVEMEVEHHDEVLAATSHLPHLLAYALVDSLARDESHQEIFRYAAGGFRDFSRIASSSPVMWRDISMANRDALLHKLSVFREELEQIEEFIRAENGVELENIFVRAKQARDEHYKK